MKTVLPILFFVLISTCLAEEYSVKYNDRYSYVVDFSDGKLKAIHLAQKNKDGLSKIPQTVRINGLKFSILCDLYSTAPNGSGVIGVANIKGEVEMTKDFKPSIDGNTGSLLKK